LGSRDGSANWNLLFVSQNGGDLNFSPKTRPFSFGQTSLLAP
jgi:hypothetical protein